MRQIDLEFSYQLQLQSGHIVDFLSDKPEEVSASSFAYRRISEEILKLIPKLKTHDITKSKAKQFDSNNRGKISD